ncbi:hypothetical protein AF331_15700 [Rossellomorea marisflavi]|uniref:HTH cro/C1-type domain-containing protein n=1 Tax=Rossellomorea marisflavi TaxID=189381 RepID=A0A0M0G1E8_9BACI|nr:helix-turn-helix transcriptional regulator [Rossellomorea marisflavi]KON83624.1 hypothetical protein AF331_15700 [Rossellomorea marisflavi]MCM2591898.1 helix-turn-helix transcriptional regulator [Rossellomorea marisflavi]
MKTKVKEARMEKGMTQAELARRVNATRQTIGLIEKGSFNPSLQLCIAICIAVGKTLDELFWEDDEQ